MTDTSTPPLLVRISIQLDDEIERLTEDLERLHAARDAIENPPTPPAQANGRPPTLAKTRARRNGRGSTHADRVLDSLDLLGEATVRALADHAGLSVAQTQGTLNALKHRGLARNTPTPGGRGGVWARTELRSLPGGAAANAA